VWWRLRAALRASASRVWASSGVWASGVSASTGPAEAKSPNAEAARALPPSFISLAREMALLSRAIARSSKKRAVPSSLLGDNATPPFPTLPTGAFARIVAKVVRSVLLSRNPTLLRRPMSRLFSRIWLNPFWDYYGGLVRELWTRQDQ